MIAYIPAGFPTVEGGIAAVEAAFDGGADVVEVGLPHSDPVPDGPVIQTADDIALRGALKIADVMRTVREAHRATGKPVLVMTHWNPVDRYGVERFTAELADAGGAGCILPDLPVQESALWREHAEKHGLQDHPDPGKNRSAVKAWEHHPAPWIGVPPTGQAPWVATFSRALGVGPPAFPTRQNFTGRRSGTVL